MVKTNSLYNIDIMKLYPEVPDEFINIIYTDTPYNLGSEYYIDSEGHYCFIKASDFMGKWEAMDGRWWDKYFREAFRVIKQGGYFITHNIDRQSDLWTYYARRNGFIPQQKLYWFFVDNMPKGVDITKQVDKLLGQQRVVVGKQRGAQKVTTGVYGSWGQNANADGTFNLTIGTSSLAQKYEGYTYGIAPLKQCAEEILVLWKPFKDKKMTVPRSIIENSKLSTPVYHPAVLNIERSALFRGKEKWTPQLLIANNMIPKMLESPFINHNDAVKLTATFQVIKYEQSELIPYFYEPKISPGERDEGLEDFEYKTVTDGRKNPNPNQARQNSMIAKKKNTHVSPKPERLVQWVIDLFTPPEPIIIMDTFMGSGVIPRVCKKSGIDYIGVELDPDSFKIAEAKVNNIKEGLF